MKSSGLAKVVSLDVVSDALLREPVLESPVTISDESHAKAVKFPEIVYIEYRHHWREKLRLSGAFFMLTLCTLWLFAFMKMTVEPRNL